jgi:valyl-tRNA synthetase
VIPMPPPNVTGSLHMGHAMFVTLEVVESILRIIHSHLGILIYVPIFV